MPKGAQFDLELTKLLFWGQTITNLAQNTTAAPFTSLWASLHTADPTPSGTQASNEAAYTGYTRVSVVRSSLGFSVSSGTSSAVVSPLATIAFPIASSLTSSETETNFSIGPTSAGASEIYYTGTISPTIAVTQLVTPRLTTASAITEA